MAANVKEQVDRETIRVIKCLVVEEIVGYTVKKKDIISFALLFKINLITSNLNPSVMCTSKSKNN